MPAIGNQASAKTTSTQVTSLACNVPSGIKNGQLMVAEVVALQSTITPPAGWTTVQAVNGGTGTTVGVYTRVANVEPASYTWNFSTSVTVTISITQLYGATGVRTSGTSSGTSVSSLVAPTLSGVQATDLTMVFGGIRPDSSGAPTLTMPSTSGWTNPSGSNLTATDTTFPAVGGMSYQLGNPAAPTLNFSVACEAAAVSIAVQGTYSTNIGTFIYEDNSSPSTTWVSGSSSITSEPFSPPAGSLVMVMLATAKSTSGVASYSLSDTDSTAPLTPWKNVIDNMTLVGATNPPGGDAAVYFRYMSAASSNMTVTATVTNGTATVMMIRVLMNATVVQTPVAVNGNGGKAAIKNSATTAINTAITTLKNRSMVYGIAAITSNQTLTASGAITVIDATMGDATDTCAFSTYKTNAATGTPGSSTLGYTTSSTTTGNMVMFEVVEAAPFSPIVYAGNHGLSQNYTSATAFHTFTPGRNAISGERLYLTGFSTGLVNVTAVSDTKGNTWYADTAAAIGACSLNTFWTTQDVGTLTTSDTITIQYNNAVSSQKFLYSLDGFLNTKPSRKPAFGTSASASSNTSFASNTVTPNENNQLIIYCWATTVVPNGLGTPTSCYQFNGGGVSCNTTGTGNIAYGYMGYSILGAGTSLAGQSATITTGSTANGVCVSMYTYQLDRATPEKSIVQQTVSRSNVR